MARGDKKKRAVMAAEWCKSKSNRHTIEDLISLGVIHNQELGGGHEPGSKSYSDPQPGEIVVFEDFFKRGFGVPVHPLRGWDLQSAS